MKNFDKIKAMTPREFVEFIYRKPNICSMCVNRHKTLQDCMQVECRDGVCEWLEMESEE